MMKKAILAPLALVLCCGNSVADTLIHAGRLIDGEADRASMEKTIRVSGGIIASIEDGYVTASDGDTVVDLRDSTVLPGLMDTHVHLTGEYSANSNLNRFVLNEAD